MDGPRFDLLARTLTAAGSRRRVLGSLSGVAVGALGTVVTLPRVKAKKRHKQGNAKKDNGKKGNDRSTCEPCVACPTGSNCPTCPERETCPTCPTCETCRTCPECEICPDPVVMPTCKQRCGACDLCMTQTDGPSLCGSVRSYPWDYTCDQPLCTSNNDCVGTDKPYCLTRLSAYSRTTGDYTDQGTFCPDGGARCVKINNPCSA